MNEEANDTASNAASDVPDGKWEAVSPGEISSHALNLPRRASLPPLQLDKPCEFREADPPTEKRATGHILPPFRLGRPASQWNRPVLVDTEDFRATLLATAQSLAGHGAASPNQVGVASNSARESKSRRSSLTNPNPLVDALMQASEHQQPSDEPEESLSIPPLPQEVIQQAPPVPAPTCHMVSDRELPLDSALRMVEAMERIAADKVEAAMRDRSTAGIDAGKSDRYKEMKLMLRDVVLSALTNSRLIREELASIKQEISQKSPRPRLISGAGQVSPGAASPMDASAPKIVVSAPIIINPVVSGYTSNTPSEMAHESIPRLALDHVTYSPRPVSVKCTRILLGQDVLSPSEMEKFLHAVTGGKGREKIRFCIGQPTLHQKAFVIAVVEEVLQADEWLDRIKSCKLVDSYDANFPLELPFQPGHPWEVRIRSDMSTISARWVPTRTSFNSLS